jgi:hypothetical protein
MAYAVTIVQLTFSLKKSQSEFPGPRTGDEGTIGLIPPGTSPEGMSN